MSDQDPLGLGIDTSWGPLHARELLDDCDWDLEDARQRIAGAHVAAHRNVQQTAELRRRQGMEAQQLARETRLGHDLVCREIRRRRRLTEIVARAHSARSA